MILLALTITLLLPVTASAGLFLDLFQDAIISNVAWSGTFSIHPAVLAPYNEERLDALNALLSHLSIHMGQGDGSSLVEIDVDGVPAIRLTEKALAEGTLQRWDTTDQSFLMWADGTQSLLPIGRNALFAFPAEDSDQLAGGTFLLRQLTQNRLAWLDEGRDLLSSLPTVFSDHWKASAVDTTFRKYGKAKKKIVLTLTASDVQEGSTDLLADMCQPGSLRNYLSHLVFSGRQQWTLWLDADGQLIRARYSGNAGQEGSLRKITLDWKMARQEASRRDEFTIRCPAVQGSDTDVLTFSCFENEEDFSLEFSYQRTRNKVKSTLKGTASLSWAENLTGEFKVTSTANKKKESWSIKPDIRCVNATDWEGTLQCIHTEEQRTTLDMEITASIHPETENFWTAANDEADEASNETSPEALQQAVVSALVRSLFQLPAEDLTFLIDGLDISTLMP